MRDEEDMKKVDVQRASEDYETFMRELEEDPEMRSQIQLFKQPNADKILKNNQASENKTDDDDFPEIKLTELLDDLSLNEKRHDDDEDMGEEDDEDDGEEYEEGSDIEIDN